MNNLNKNLKPLEQKEEKDKKALRLEIIISSLCALPLLIAITVVPLIPIKESTASNIVGICVLPI